MRSMHRGIALALITSLLAGCGQAGLMAPTRPAIAGMAVQSQSAAQMATAFAASLEKQTKGHVSRDGAVVTITTGDATTRYDFSATPRTQQVAVSADGVNVEVSYATLTAQSRASQLKFAPFMIVPIAIDVAIAGAKAYAVYWITHRHDFNRHDAIQTTVTAMGQALVGFLPMGFALKWLVPVVVNALMNADAQDYAHALHALMSRLDDIVAAIKHMLAGDPAPKIAY